MPRVDEQCQAICDITWQLAYARDFIASLSEIKLANKIEGMRVKYWTIHPTHTHPRYTTGGS